MIRLAKEEARRFLLYKQGLFGGYRFQGKKGVLAFIRQAGCIQFDPVDICGKNPELVLQSRVKGVTKPMLYDLLYRDRKLVDHFDKNLAIYPVEDWPCFSRVREQLGERSKARGDLDSEKAGQVIAAFGNREFLSAKELSMGESVNWYWGRKTSPARIFLECLYFEGKLCIHHKEGAIKYYALPERCLPPELLFSSDPHLDELDYLKWRVLRRIGGVGALWNRPSDAWLGIHAFHAADRKRVFHSLLEEGSITELAVEEIREPLYCLTADLPLLEESRRPLKGRTELIAPLDNLLWDRKLVEAIFGFSYKWEVYTPVTERKYGHYVLPVLDKTRFAGRAELVRSGTVLTVKHLWAEPGVKQDRLESRLKERLPQCAAFNSCETVEWE